MKKLMYLFVAGTVFAFTACGGGGTATEEPPASDLGPEIEKVELEVEPNVDSIPKPASSGDGNGGDDEN